MRRLDTYERYLLQRFQLVAANDAPAVDIVIPMTERNDTQIEGLATLLTGK